MSTCPTCHEDVIDLDDGTRLNPKPGRLGRHLKDGSILTPDQIRDPFIPGYYEHHCLPRKTATAATKKHHQPEQTLF